MRGIRLWWVLGLAGMGWAGFGDKLGIWSCGERLSEWKGWVLHIVVSTVFNPARLSFATFSFGDRRAGKKIAVHLTFRLLPITDCTGPSPIRRRTAM